MRLIRTSTENECALMSTLLQLGRTENFCAISQLDEQGVLEVIIGYDGWSPNSVQMHVWIRPGRGFCRRMLREMFRFAFIMNERGVALATTQADNRAALEVIRRIGFRYVGPIRDGWLPGTDLAIWELRREHCKWIEEFPSVKRLRSGNPKLHASGAAAGRF